MNFSDTLASVVPHEGRWRARVGADWLQGRSAFGGLQAALGLKVMRALVPAGLPLRSLQVTFVAPVPAGSVQIRASVLREGKNVVHVAADLCDGEAVPCRLLGVFGAARTSTLAFGPEPEPMDDSRAPVLPYVEGVAPAFMQQFDVRWLRGDLPFSGGKGRSSVLELSLRDEGPATEMHAVALADFMPPIALSMFRQPTPGSSLTWMLELLRDRFDDLPLRGWRADGELLGARDGYTHQRLMLWGPGGEPVARGHQTMVVFG